MAVGATFPSAQRWRALGRVSDLRCPLHQYQMALSPPLARCLLCHHLRASPCYPRPMRLARLSEQPKWGPPSRRLVTAAVADLGVLLFASATAAAYSGPAAAAAAAAAAGASAAAASLPPLLVALASLLPSIGNFLLCVAAAVFLLASLPAVWALARTAHRAERVLAVLESELPDTVASMRLAGLELTDCVQELGALGGELTRGVRSTAALATAAETGVRGGVAAAGSALQNHVLPAVATAERSARGAVEGHLVATSKLEYTAPLASQAAAATTTAVRRLRAGLAVGRLVEAAVQAGRAARESLHHYNGEQEAAAQREARQQRRQSAEAEAKMRRQLEEDERALREELEWLKAKQLKQHRGKQA